jgi:ketosteroid isomerase-like protein
MTADPRDVEATVQARADALAAQDWAVVEAQLHEDFVYTNSRGERLSKQAYLAFLRDGPLRWNRQWLEDAQVSTVGATAVVTGVVVDDLLVDGEPHLLRFATTQTYVQVDGGWLYLAGQTAPTDVASS